MPGQISRFLPIRFANGASISRFAKHCPHCKTLVQSESMIGEAALVQDRLFIIAVARCTQCNHAFKVTCVVTDDKRVHKALLPQWLLLVWLKQVTPANAPAQDARDWSFDAEENAPAASGGVTLPSGSEPVPSDEVIGRYENAPIPATLSVAGRRFVFDRVQPDALPAVLASNELLYQRHLVYRES
ncbi:hypothetical protein [Crenobacter caeni]|uniref:Uncharacterized protein n=1 Tax=Crenobacter caeni TaxID=2705474 RepID=A0A6B2KW08_9NEIS|nr:hypothetical protein [Crenobacter caeni]NDV14193.1 hypothetical protein [Crenobacter caeni]